MRPLPIELYREISKNLDGPSTRPTLLSLALVNKVWSTESQRVLFRRFCYFEHPTEYGTDYTHIHLQFLEAILSRPERLGGYVHTYAQCGIACDPITVSSQEAAYRSAQIRLWELTATALPFMIKLKHLIFKPALVFKPARQSPGAAEAMLRGCRFQLETLVWGCDDDLSEMCTAFLPTQNELKHLAVGNDSQRTNLSELPPDACPSLSSVVLCFESMSHIAEKRNIKALRMHAQHNKRKLSSHLDRRSSALDRLQYLSVVNYYMLRRFFGLDPLNIVLLELQSWAEWMIQMISDLPKLRLLSLLDREAAPAGEPTTHGDIAVECFELLPALKVVLIQDQNQVLFDTTDGSKKFTVARRTNERGAVLDVACEELSIQYHLDTVWWTVYEGIESL